MHMRFHIQRLDEHWISGWAFDPADPLERLQVEVIMDGRRLGEGLAAKARADLARVGFADGACGFQVSLRGAAAGQPAKGDTAKPT